jgi:SH3 domain protein
MICFPFGQSFTFLRMVSYASNSLRVCFPVVPFLLSTTALAETRYVTDELTINLRRGMGNEYRILKMLPTGTPVQVLERQGEYSRVRDSDGTEGYVLSRFLTSETPKGLVAAQLERERDDLINELAQVRESFRDVDAQYTRYRNEIAALTRAHDEAQAGFEEFQGKYERLRQDAENVVALQQELDQLKAENLALESEVISWKEASSDALRTGMIRWFVAGGGVLFTGWVLGNISLNRRKRSSLKW